MSVKHDQILGLQFPLKMSQLFLGLPMITSSPKIYITHLVQMNIVCHSYFFHSFHSKHLCSTGDSECGDRCHDRKPLPHSSNDQWDKNCRKSLN